MQADPMLKKQADKYVDVDFNKWRDAWWTGTPSNDRGLGIDMFAMMMFEQLHGTPYDASSSCFLFGCTRFSPQSEVAVADSYWFGPACCISGIPEADLTKTPPSDFSAFLKAKQISLLMRGRSFPFKLMLQVLQTLPDSFYALKNHANGQLFQSIVVEHPESGDVATFSVPGESMTEVGNGKASLAIFE